MDKQKPLNPVEARVLGSLIEKEMTTPEYYPLTLNALTNACNQKNNREPVVSYSEQEVAKAIESLRDKKLLTMVTGDGIRVPKYKHTITGMLNLSLPELAILDVLLLRGGQTVGELRGRCATMYTFESLANVQVTLEALISDQTRQSVVKLLPRQPGQKEARYAHLLSGEPILSSQHDASVADTVHSDRTGEEERITKLEEDVTSLQLELEKLRRQLIEFKKQFE